MDNVKFIEHKGKKILFQNLKDSRDADTNISIFEEAKQIIVKMPANSVLLLTDVTNAHYDIKAAENLKTFSREVTPFVKASAALGVTGIKRILLQTLLKITGRQIQICSDIDEALEYLVNHK